MNTPDRNTAPRTHDELAALLFAPGKGHTTLPVAHKALEGDDEAARVFFDLPAKPITDSEE